MIRNFDHVVQQLAALSESINKFKSEQVQLKIVELIFKNAAGSDGEDGAANPPATGRKRAKRRGRGRQTKLAAPLPNGDEAKKRSAAKPRGTGPVSTLNTLIDRGFFKQTRTIGDIVEHCKNDLALTFPMNNLSGPLARLVRNQKLTRKKNAENQYEYTTNS